MESLGEMGAFLSSDSLRISSPDHPPGLVIAGVIPQLDVSIILPASSPSSDTRAPSPQCPQQQETVETPSMTVETPSMEEVQEKLDNIGLHHVTDHSDPLSLSADQSPVPPVKLQLQSSQSNGLFSQVMID